MPLQPWYNNAVPLQPGRAARRACWLRRLPHVRLRRPMAVAARVVLSRYSVFALTLLYIVVGFISELQTSVNDATTTSYVGTY